MLFELKQNPVAATVLQLYTDNYIYKSLLGYTL